MAVACLCAGAFAPAAAQAQTTNFYLWRTTITVGEASGYLGYHATDSLGSISTGAQFNYPPWSPPHKHHFDPDYRFTVGALYIDPSGTEDRLTLEIAFTGESAITVGNITLWIGNTSFPVDVLGGASTQYGFAVPDVPDLDWSENDEVGVVLSYTRELPSAPQNVSVTAPPGEDGTLEVSWDEPDDEGTFPIECYLVEFRHPSGEAKKRKQSYPGSLGPGNGCGDSPPTSVRRTDLETGVQYQVLVQALSGDGYSEWSETKTVRANGRTLRSDLTASFVGMPRKHDGERAFRFRVAFSENIGISYRSLREDAFTVTGGRVVGGKRVDDRRDLFRMTVEPDGDGDVTITLPEGRKCGVSGAICTKGKNRRRLTNTPSATILGPASGMDFAHFAKGATIASEMVLVNAAQQTTLDFAHFANGTGITSEMVFLNPSTQPSRPAVYFYDTEGNPIPAESVVDLTGDLEITEDGALTVWTEMEPLGELTISTHGRGELVTGSVRVVSDGPIGGMLRFEHPGVGAGVVGASPPISDAIFPVRRQEGGINTWAAIHNLESSPGLLRCDLMREGVLLDAASIPLEANGQTSWFIDQAFPAADTSDFAGSVRCDAVGEGRFSAVALEIGPRHPHLHDASGGAGSREDGSGIDAGGVPVLSEGHGRIKPCRANKDCFSPPKFSPAWTDR